MLSAIFGLLGVVIGGIITGVVTFILDHVRQKQAVRATSRLMVEDLQTASLLAESIRKDSKWPKFDPKTVQKRFEDPTKLWLADRQILAAVVSGKEWVALSLTYEEGLRLLHTLYVDRPESNEQDEAPVPRWVDFLLLTALTRMEPGIKVLQKYSGVDYQRDDPLRPPERPMSEQGSDQGEPTRN